MLELFLPEKLFGIRILPKRILGIDLSSKKAVAVKAHTKNNQTIIEGVYQEYIDSGDEKTYADRAAKAVRRLVKSKNYDNLYISIPASKVVFKEVTVPLKDVNKIRMIIEHEIEEQLPFSIDSAVIDFIITEQSKKTEVSQVLVAAIRNSDLQEILDIYNKAGVDPTNITIDFFALYNTYKLIPEYKNITDGTSLIDVGNKTTRISFIENGKLRLIRNIPKGISTIAQAISNETGMPVDEVETGLISGDIVENTEAKKHILNYANDISFTLNSFSIKLAFYKEIKKIFFTNFNIELANLISDSLQTSCELFNINQVIKLDKIKSKVKKKVDWDNYGVALSTALTATMPYEFNFRRKSFEHTNMSLLRKQVTAGLALVSISILSLGLFGYWQIGRLSNVSQTLEEREISKIKILLVEGQRTTRDPSINRMISRSLDEVELEPLFKKMSQIVASEEKAWLDLDNLNTDALNILFNLTEIIDRKAFNIKITDIFSGALGGSLSVEVEGILQSKVIGEDWNEFAKFTQQIESDSKARGLSLENIDDALADDGGVKFKLTFKLKG